MNVLWDKAALILISWIVNVFYNRRTFTITFAWFKLLWLKYLLESPNMYCTIACRIDMVSGEQRQNVQISQLMLSSLQVWLIAWMKQRSLRNGWASISNCEYIKQTPAGHSWMFWTNLRYQTWGLNLDMKSQKLESLKELLGLMVLMTHVGCLLHWVSFEWRVRTSNYLLRPLDNLAYRSCCGFWRCSLAPNLCLLVSISSKLMPLFYTSN